MGGLVMKKLLSVLFILVIFVTYSTQDKAFASKDELPEIMKTTNIAVTHVK